MIFVLCLIKSYIQMYSIMKLLVILVIVDVTLLANCYNYHQLLGLPIASRIHQLEIDSGNTSTNPYNNSQIRNNSNLAKPKTHPFFAALIVHLENVQGKSICGSTLVSTDRLLTAAHCWHDGANQAMHFTVVLGSDEVFRGGTRVVTNKVQVHPEYDPVHFFNDIAVISLDYSVRFDDAIRSIALPSGTQTTMTYIGKRVFIYGVGFTSDEKGLETWDGKLREASARVISNDECKLVFPANILDSTLCTAAGKAKVGICGGDSGGSLVYYGKRNPILIGINSFGAILGEAGYPSGYVRITKFLSFITSHM